MQRNFCLKGLIVGIIGTSFAAATAQQPLYGRSTLPATPAVTGIYANTTGLGYAIYGLSQSDGGYAGFFRGRGYFSSQVQIGGRPTSFAEILLINGNTRLVGNLQLVGSLSASSNASVGGALTVYGSTNLNDSLIVGGQSILSRLTVSGPANLNGGLVVNNAPAQFNQNVTIGAGGAARSLTVNGNITVTGNANLNTVSLASLTVTGANVQGTSFTVSGTALFNSSLTVAQNFSVNGDSRLGNVNIGSGNGGGSRLLRVYGTFETFGNATVSNNLTVRGVSNLGGDVLVGAPDALRNLTVWGDTNLNGNVSVGKQQLPRNLTVWGELSVAGSANLKSISVQDLRVNGGTQLNTLTVQGAARLTQPVVIGGGEPRPNQILTVAGNATVGGSLSAGATTLSQLTVNGVSTLNGTVTVGNNSDLQVSRDVIIARGLNVGNDAVLQGALTVTGNSTLIGQVAVETNLRVDQETLLNTLTVTDNSRFRGNVTVGAPEESRSLEIKGDLILSNNGAFVVSDAGINTPTAAFMFEYSEGSDARNAALITHPLLQAATNPLASRAIVIATFNGTNGVSLTAPYGVRYNTDLEGWEVYLLDPTQIIPDGATFNILIILPSAPQR